MRIQTIPLYFNPHHREGGDDMKYTRRMGPYDFNPHHREGGDFSRTPQSSYSIGFQSHHREGGDQTLLEAIAPFAISIHTTAKVVTNGGCAGEHY